MLRLIGIFCTIAAVATATLPAAARTVPRPYDPTTTFRGFSREDVVEQPEVIVEGVVEPYKPTEGEPNDFFGFTKMRIDRIWKGDLGSTVVVIFQTASSDCSKPPPYGQRLRFGVDLVEKSILISKHERSTEDPRCYWDEARPTCICCPSYEL